jgi:hypothetical protein
VVPGRRTGRLHQLRAGWQRLGPRDYELRRSHGLNDVRLRR